MEWGRSQRRVLGRKETWFDLHLKRIPQAGELTGFYSKWNGDSYFHLFFDLWRFPAISKSGHSFLCCQWGGCLGYLVYHIAGNRRYPTSFLNIAQSCCQKNWIKTRDHWKKNEINVQYGKAEIKQKRVRNHYLRIFKTRTNQVAAETIMAAATLRRMRGAQQAKLRPRPAIQVPGGLALPLVLALLLASATMSSALSQTDSLSQTVLKTRFYSKYECFNK